MQDGAVSRRGVLGVLAAVGGSWVGTATGTGASGTRTDRTATTQTDAIPCPAYQYDVGHRGYVPEAAGPVSSPVERRWRLTVDDLLLPGQAVLGGGLLYLIGTDTLYAVDVSAGEVRWDYPVGSLDNREPYAATLDSDTVYAPGDGTLYALDASTGAERWTAEAFVSAPTVAGGTVYTTAGAFDADDGSQVWTTDLDIDDAVAVADDAVYVTHRLNGELYELDRTTGRENWRVRVGEDWNSTPTVVGNRVVFANTNGDLYVVDRAAGEVIDRLTYDTGGYVRYPPAVDGTTAYVLDHNGGALHAVDLELGEARWTTGVEGDELYSRAPVVAGETVYLGGDSEVLALTAGDGSVRWRHKLDGGDKAWTVTVHDGTCYAPVQGGYLLAIEEFNREPSAGASYSPEEPAPGTGVTFSGADSSDPDGELASYEWDLDADGSFEASGREVTHTFDAPGEYPVTLRVTDGDGATDTTTVTVTVTETPTPTGTPTATGTPTETPADTPQSTPGTGVTPTTTPRRTTVGGTAGSPSPTVQPPETTTSGGTGGSPSPTPTAAPTETEPATGTNPITPTGDLGGDGATDADGPGFGVLAALGGGGLSVLLRRAWREARDVDEDGA